MYADENSFTTISLNKVDGKYQMAKPIKGSRPRFGTGQRLKKKK